jgi:hypothetical protein
MFYENPWLAKQAGKMELMNSQLNEVGYHYIIHHRIKGAFTQAIDICGLGTISTLTIGTLPG